MMMIVTSVLDGRCVLSGRSEDNQSRANVSYQSFVQDNAQDTTLGRDELDKTNGRLSTSRARRQTKTSRDWNTE